MLGFDDVRALAHAAEDVLASVRTAGVFPPGFAAPLLRATAALRAQVNGTAEPVAGLLDDLATQFTDNLAATGLQLSTEEMQLLDEASQPPAPDYPYGEPGQSQRTRRIQGGRF